VIRAQKPSLRVAETCVNREAPGEIFGEDFEGTEDGGGVACVNGIKRIKWAGISKRSPVGGRSSQPGFALEIMGNQSEANSCYRGEFYSSEQRENWANGEGYFSRVATRTGVEGWAGKDKNIASTRRQRG